MLSELANIGRTIDSLISGTVQFLYSIFTAVFLIYRNPTRGAIRLHQVNSISSTTLLFLACATVIAILTYGASDAVKTLFNATSPSLIVYVAVVISLYIVSDVCVHVLSVWCGPWGRRRARARDCLRYCFGSVLLGWSFVFPMIVYFNNEYIVPRYFPNEFISETDLEIMLVVSIITCFVLAYPLFMALFFFGRRRRGSGAPGLIGVAALVTCTLIVVIATLNAPVGGFVSAAVMNEEVESTPGPVVSGFSCQEIPGGGVLRVSAAVFNPSSAAIVLGDYALGAEVGPIDDPGEVSVQFSFPEAGQPLIALAPHEVSVITYDAKINAQMKEALSKARTCKVTYAFAQEPSQPIDVGVSSP